MLLPSTMQPSVAAPTCKPGTVTHGVNLRVSTFRPPNLVRSSVTQERRPSRKPIAAAAEVVGVPEVVAAQEQKKKIAIFVEPSPFSHVSGRLGLPHHDKHTFVLKRLACTSSVGHSCVIFHAESAASAAQTDDGNGGV